MSDTENKKTSLKDTEGASLSEMPSTSYDLEEVSQKLATALYLVTGLMSDEEPLKWHLRRKAISLVSDTGRALRLFKIDKEEDVLASLQTSCRETVSLIRVSAISGIVSTMNEEIIVLQMNAFMSDMRSILEREDGKGGLIKKILSYKRPLLLGRPENKYNFSQGHSQGQSFSNQAVLPKQSVKKIILRVRPNGNGLEGKARKEKITALVREKGSVMIKDIAGAIQDCSEKTLQRDLGDLVREGVLKRKGERRWTVYFV
ncbi:MAG: DeoR family transcriptional regulator [Patescibacteria group bacterium]